MDPRLSALHARRRRIRRGVVATSLATFAIAFGFIAETGSLGAVSAQHASASPSSPPSSQSSYDDSSWQDDSSSVETRQS